MNYDSAGKTEQMKIRGGIVKDNNKYQSLSNENPFDICKKTINISVSNLENNYTKTSHNKQK